MPRPRWSATTTSCSRSNEVSRCCGASPPSIPPSRSPRSLDSPASPARRRGVSSSRSSASDTCATTAVCSSSRRSSSTSGTRTSRRASSPTSCSPTWRRCPSVATSRCRHRCSTADEIVYIARVPTKRIMTIALSLGSRLPAAITSMGRVLLADLPDDELQRAARRDDRRRSAPTTPRSIRPVSSGWSSARCARKGGRWSTKSSKTACGPSRHRCEIGRVGRSPRSTCRRTPDESASRSCGARSCKRCSRRSPRST